MSKCASYETYTFLFFSEQDPSVYPASLPWVRFGKCISGCGVPVHRRHPSPLSGGSDKRGRRRVRPLLSSSSNPPIHKRHRDTFSIIYHWYFDEKILQLCYGRWTFLLVLIHEQAMNVQMWIISRILGMTKSREVKDRRNLALPKAPESN